MDQQQLLKKIDHLQEEVETIKHKINNLSIHDKVVYDHGAITLLKEAIRGLVERGVKTVDAIDLHHKTGLPLEQISRVIPILEKEGVLSDE